MLRTERDWFQRGAPSDLIEAAQIGVRLLVRLGRAHQLDDVAIRHDVIERYRAILAHEDHDDREREDLMAVVQRTIESALDMLPRLRLP